VYRLNFCDFRSITGIVVGLAIFGLGMAKGIRSEQGPPRGSRLNNLRSSVGLTGHSSSAAAINMCRYGTFVHLPMRIHKRISHFLDIVIMG
jgi:hypothetical protein